MSEQKGNGKKRIALALQGGGSHGAFTWGILDALFEENSLDVEGVVGTSAGGMNATAVAQGFIKGGNEGAREALKLLWKGIGDQGKKSPIKPSPQKKRVHNYDISDNPLYVMMNWMTGMWSPYQLSPNSPHPLEAMVEGMFDFDALKKSKDHKLFLCATHVATGKTKVFSGEELCKEAVLASACVPTLFKAIEIGGEFYWDGGFIANPAVYPLIYNCETPDVMIIQIRRVYDPQVPVTAHDINNRLGEITQNSCLTRELRAINFVTELIDNGTIEKGKLKRLNLHLIRDDAFFGGIDRASGFCADPDFLEYLFKAGRRCGKRWIEENYDNIGKKSTADLQSDYI